LLQELYRRHRCAPAVLHRTEPAMGRLQQCAMGHHRLGFAEGLRYLGWPAAPGGSIPFLPDATMRVLRTVHDHYPNAWSRYGFVDAFNPLTEWYDTDVVG